MKLIRQLIIVVVAVFVLAALIGLFLPDRGEVSRSATIDAPPSVVFAQIDDFHNYNQWSPWATLPTGAPEFSYEGPRRGSGATMHWKSDYPGLGNGSQTIIASEPHQSIAMRIDFAGGSANADFTLRPDGDGTELTWAYRSEFGSNIVARYMGLMMDSSVGKTLETGLANLKAHVSRLPKVDFGDLAVETVRVSTQTQVSTPAQSDNTTAAIGEALSAAYFRILQYMDEHGLERSGAPLAVFEDLGDSLEFDARIPIDTPAEIPEPFAAVEVLQGYEGDALMTMHIGAYDYLPDTHERMRAYIEAVGYQSNGDYWEEYVTDPADVTETELQTRVYYPVLISD